MMTLRFGVVLSGGADVTQRVSRPDNSRGKRKSIFSSKDIMNYIEWCIIERVHVNYNNCNI